MSLQRSTEAMLWRERVANRPKHWVRAVTACNSRCLFCLDSDTPRDVFLPADEVKAEIDRGRDELGAEKIIISGGEASLHPEFADFIRYARERGYDRVQTVTNGYRFAEREFYEACMAAGLGEITFSLHGHTPELHDRLTQTRGAFKRLIKGMVRALRDPRRPIVNVDVVINKQNVAVIDKIVELCISLGVTEFDLLHVIPQAAAFENRDELFYDVSEHLPVLRKVFQLTRHPKFVVWTNRFPVAWLEGLEDLIQDPHKMLDEVNGRRYQVRRYLDTGEPLDCRQPERCEHCFIEPFCTTMDRVVSAQNSDAWEVWWVGEGERPDGSLPYGCDLLGLSVPDFEELSAAGDAGIYARVDCADPIPARSAAEPARRLVLVANTPAQLEAWLRPPVPEGVEVEIELSDETARWMLAHRELLREPARTGADPSARPRAHGGGGRPGRPGSAQLLLAPRPASAGERAAGLPGARLRSDSRAEDPRPRALLRRDGAPGDPHPRPAPHRAGLPGEVHPLQGLPARLALRRGPHQHDPRPGPRDAHPPGGRPRGGRRPGPGHGPLARAGETPGHGASARARRPQPAGLPGARRGTGGSARGDRRAAPEPAQAQALSWRTSATSS